MSRPRYTDEQLAERRQGRADAAQRIDLRTAHGLSNYHQDFDPYGEIDLPPDLDQVSKCFWLCDPDERIWITEYDLRYLYPDYSIVEWRELVEAASARFAESNSPPKEVASGEGPKSTTGQMEIDQ